MEGGDVEMEKRERGDEGTIQRETFEGENFRELVKNTSYDNFCGENFRSADCSLMLCQGQNRKTKFFLKVSHCMLHACII